MRHGQNFNKIWNWISKIVLKWWLIWISYFQFDSIWFAQLTTIRNVNIGFKHRARVFKRSRQRWTRRVKTLPWRRRRSNFGQHWLYNNGAGSTRVFLSISWRLTHSIIGRNVVNAMPLLNYTERFANWHSFKFLGLDWTQKICSLIDLDVAFIYVDSARCKGWCG